MKKIGLLGGSFDPIHLGHIGIAKEALKQLKLDEVWFIVSFQPNLKEPLVADFLSRMDMVEIAIRDEEKLKVIDVEKKLPLPSYTINTIITLKADYPDCEFTFLIGSDQAEQLDKWHRIAELQEMVAIRVISRDGKEGDVKIPLGNYPQSSTAIRRGKVEFLDNRVWEYIVSHELYLEGIVANRLSEKRFGHTLNTIETALSLAFIHLVDRHKTYLAALFHDIAKNESEEFLLANLTVEEKKQPAAIWHQYVGAKMVRDYYGISDQSIYDAIYNHSSGNCHDILAMIIYCADKIEPSRDNHNQELYLMCSVDLQGGFNTIKANNDDFIAKKY